MQQRHMLGAGPNTRSQQYEKLVDRHLLVGTAPICHATLELDIVIEAVRSLHSPGTELVPVVSNMENHKPIC